MITVTFREYMSHSLPQNQVYCLTSMHKSLVFFLLQGTKNCAMIQRYKNWCALWFPSANAL